MHTDKAIAEFEAWYRDRFPMAERMIQAGSGVWITHRDEMEECWLASRRDLVVELPQPMNAPPYASYEGGWNDMRGEAIDAIEAAGVTVRG